MRASNEMRRWARAATLLAALGPLGGAGLFAPDGATAQAAAQGSPAARGTPGQESSAQRSPSRGTLRAPGSVQAALGIMSRAVADSAGFIASGRYNQLPRESRELEVALTALEHGLGRQPLERRSKLEALTGKARIAASAMAEAVESHQDSLLPLAHRQLADAVSALIASFPPQLRPQATDGGTPAWNRPSATRDK